MYCAMRSCVGCSRSAMTRAWTSPRAPAWTTPRQRPHDDHVPRGHDHRPGVDVPQNHNGSVILQTLPRAQRPLRQQTPLVLQQVLRRRPEDIVRGDAVLRPRAAGRGFRRRRPPRRLRRRVRVQQSQAVGTNELVQHPLFHVVQRAVAGVQPDAGAREKVAGGTELAAQFLHHDAQGRVAVDQHRNAASVAAEHDGFSALHGRPPLNRPRAAATPAPGLRRPRGAPGPRPARFASRFLYTSPASLLHGGKVYGQTDSSPYQGRPKYAASTRHAAGAAAAPPPPPCSMSTATATSGSSTGAKAANHAWVSPPPGTWAEPVLPATSTGKSRNARAVPRSGHHRPQAAGARPSGTRAPPGGSAPPAPVRARFRPWAR